MRLCQNDNWISVLDDPAPRAVRWATRDIASRFEPDWGKWHWTEGNGAFTACRRPVVPFLIDGSPEEAATAKVNCRVCASKMRLAGLLGDRKAKLTAEDLGAVAFEADAAEQQERIEGSIKPNPA